MGLSPTAARDGMISMVGGWHPPLDILIDRLADREPASFWRTYPRLEAEYNKLIPAR